MPEELASASTDELVEVFRAANDRDGVIRQYTVHRLPDGQHYRHTISVLDRDTLDVLQSLWMDKPHDVEHIKHDRIVADMQEMQDDRLPVHRARLRP